MEYKNGRDVLPPSLLEELQRYVGGELIYVPKAEEQRVPWGEASGTRKLLAERNREICLLRSEGWTVAELERRFHLSDVSIRKILSASRKRTGGGAEERRDGEPCGRETADAVRRMRPAAIEAKLSSR